MNHQTNDQHAYATVPNAEAGARAAGWMPTDESFSSAQTRRYRADVVAGAVSIVIAGLICVAVQPWKGFAGFGPVDFHRKSHHHRQPVQLYQSSLYTEELMSEVTLDPPLKLRDTSKCDTDGDWDGARIRIDGRAENQEVLGFGGAFTDAAASIFWQLPEAARTKVIDAYFGEDGIGYTIGRIPMDSTDFSLGSFSFDDVEGDYALEHFDTDVKKDQEEKIPMIAEAIAANRDIKFFISPWSPPAWMKEPVEGKQDMKASAWPQGLIDDPKIYQTWADYFVKFIDAYQQQQIPIWGLTVQNEPENVGPWEACVWNSTSQGAFIRDYLGPVIRDSYPDMKIMAYDHNRDHIVEWTQTLMSDPDTAQYIDGMAMHWYYASIDRGMDGSYGWGQVDRVHDLLSRDQFILSSESCNCPYVLHDLEGGWWRAEHYAHEIIADLNNWAVGWVDWNLLLNFEGGPNHLGNLCDSPIYATKDFSDVVFQPMFHYFGHISKFIVPGSVHLTSSVRGSYKKGGNMSSGVLVGYETTSYQCEGSVRQSWNLRDDGKIELVELFTENLPTWEPVCLSSRPNVNTEAIEIVLCAGNMAGVWRHDDEGRLVSVHQEGAEEPGQEHLPEATIPAAAVEPAPKEDPPGTEEKAQEHASGDVQPEAAAGDATGLVPGPETGGDPATAPPAEGADAPDTGAQASADGAQRRREQEVHPTDPPADLEIYSQLDHCLTIIGNKQRDGAIVGLAPCRDSAKNKHAQLWEVEDGRVTSTYNGNCLTAGWPFLTGAAFKLPSDRIGLLVLNQAEEDLDLKVDLPDDQRGLDTSIPARSFRTYIL